MSFLSKSPYYFTLSRLPSLLSTPPFLCASRERCSYIILLHENNPSFTVPAQRPPNFTITQLLRADLARESSIGLVEHVLATDFDFRLEMLANEEEEETGWGDDDFY